MQSFIPITLLGLAAFTNAQSECDSVAATVPSCAVACIASAGSTIGCTAIDYTCQCTDAHYQAIQTAAQTCVITSCGIDNALKIISAAEAVCACAAAHAAAPSSAAPSFSIGSSVPASASSALSSVVASATSAVATAYLTYSASVSASGMRTGGGSGTGGGASATASASSKSASAATTTSAVATHKANATASSPAQFTGAASKGYQAWGVEGAVFAVVGGMMAFL